MSAKQENSRTFIKTKINETNREIATQQQYKKGLKREDISQYTRLYMNFTANLLKYHPESIYSLQVHAIKSANIYIYKPQVLQASQP